MPKIRDGCCGELLLNDYAVEDRGFVKEFQSETTIPLLNAGQSVFFTVQVHQIPSELREQAEQKECFVDGPGGPYVQVRLEEALKLRLRGSKTPALYGCKCKIPCLGDKEAVSLNHAYTLISTHFETKRISHSGNVFQLGWWFDEGQKRWVQLDDLRMTLPPADRRAGEA
ncbi:MAG: hypothetical protein NTZ17_00820 [Phycisphaerae bacterium]|nr:hypothetical protein [Phycisphaerae bacterium]